MELIGNDEYYTNSKLRQYSYGTLYNVTKIAFI